MKGTHVCIEVKDAQDIYDVLWDVVSLEDCYRDTTEACLHCEIDRLMTVLYENGLGDSWEQERMWWKKKKKSLWKRILDAWLKGCEHYGHHGGWC